MSSGGGLYATSSQTFKSFGSGNGGAVVGGGMRGGATMSNSSSPITYGSSGVGAMTSSPNSPITLSPNSLITPLSNPDGSYAAAPARSSSLFGVYGDIYASTTVGSYNPMSSVYGGHGYAGVRGRQNAAGIVGSWEEWLADWLAANGNAVSPDLNGDGQIDEDELASFMAYIEAHWNEGMADKPTEDDIRDFLVANLPVGDIIPLLLLALMYIAFILSKSLKSVNENK